MNTIKTIIAAAATLLMACATVSLPPERVDSADGLIRQAEAAGAANIPQAQLHLQLAKDQREMAQKMSAEGNERAKFLLARAQLDAELALALSQEAHNKREVNTAAGELQRVQMRGGQQ